MTGRSIGHVQSPHGLFLFPPADDRGGVQRMFVPASTYREFEIGPRIGQVLVEQSAVTSEQVDIAVAEQAALRARELGDLLVTNRIVAPEELLAAIDQQARMPVVRSGEARVALGLTRLPIELDVARRLSHQSMNQYRVLLLLLRLPRGARLFVAVDTLSNIPHLKSQCAMAGTAWCQHWNPETFWRVRAAGLGRNDLSNLALTLRRGA